VAKDVQFFFHFLNYNTMGKTQIIPLIIRRSATKEFIASWPVKSAANVHGLGQPTSERLSQWRDKFNQSLKKGGCNEHLGMKYWMQYKIEVYNQKTGQVLAQYTPPMFEVIND
jgi:hypothetical protein